MGYWQHKKKKEPDVIDNENQIEAQIIAAGKTAPRLRPSDIDAKIENADYHRFEGTSLTVCALTLSNGFVVTGESSAASPENYDETIGRKIAYENAREKIWMLEGYLLRERLALQQIPKDPVMPEIKGEVLDDGVQLAKPVSDEPIPFSD